jgi:nitrogen fixation protein FixH
MASNVSNSKRARAGLNGYHALLWFCGFFGLMFVVNGFFLFYAITTFPGEDVKKSYVQGLDYNRTLAQRAAQAELGWQAEIGLSGQHLEIRIVDSTGAGIGGHEVQVQLRRLATTADDTVASAVPQGDGVYFVDISTFAHGQWEVIADVIKPGDEGALFEARKRVTIG